MAPLAYSNIPYVITEDSGGAPARYIYIGHVTFVLCRPQWPRDLRSGSAAAPCMGLWFRIPPGAWMSVSCECCVLSGQITRPEESYRVWFIWCDNESSTMRRPWPTGGSCAMVKKKITLNHRYNF